MVFASLFLWRCLVKEILDRKPPLPSEKHVYVFIPKDDQHTCHNLRFTQDV